ncbi:MAG TPA: fumarate/nitrate reduction transcriptional regulator Fnr [Burkholderiales bacterium]|nr:fumarate/nitrate reduction transcriptional regulator Fnr [Burkholderiales bacterium]
MAAPQHAGSAGTARCATNCSSCGLRELCLPCGMSGTDLDRIDQLIYTRRRIKRGEALYQAGDPFKSLYAVRSGFFKSSVLMESGREQVTSFHMPGDLMGMDGIGADQHGASAVALEDSEVCVIVFSALEQASLEVRPLQRQFHKVMSRELVRDQGVMMLLGAMRAEERMATFLLNLSQRFKARGYSQTEFHLRMTREEIGSYLGLKLETVSRIFSRFQDEGLVEVQQKHIRILDVEGLKKVAMR